MRETLVERSMECKKDTNFIGEPLGERNVEWLGEESDGLVAGYGQAEIEQIKQALLRQAIEALSIRPSDADKEELVETRGAPCWQ